MTQRAIEVRHIWKKFHLGEMHDSLRDLVPALAGRLLGRRPARAELGKGDFWALKDVSFEVRRGETFAIVGHNGAGKSTMLKILSRILKPNRGRIQVQGKLRALIEVASGFHPDLSGRENIYLNGAILGMRRREIATKFDAIVEFSGVERFLDTPVKRYSSGMQARLGFAVAAHLDPDVLLVDEVLAVGDREFQDRCLRRMQETAEGGTAVVFVSHNLAAVQQFCHTGMLLQKGEVQTIGPIHEVVAAYVGVLQANNAAAIDLSQSPARRQRAVPIVRSIKLLGRDRLVPTSHIPVGDPLRIELEIEPPKELSPPMFCYAIDDSFGRRVFSLLTTYSTSRLPKRLGPAMVACDIDEIRLAPGLYSLSIAAGTEQEPLMDSLDHAVTFEVVSADYFGRGSVLDGSYGCVLQRATWQAEPLEGIASEPPGRSKEAGR